ncbi:MAG: hypothetical protein GY720_24640 [bacterium]|nr:hypothetical protein [bacterium]
MSEQNQLGPNPLDTVASGSLRFLVEIFAWVAGPWAAGRWLGGWAVAVALVALLALPSVFSVAGDKHQVIRPVSGPVRFGIEVLLGIVAVVAAWSVWPAWLAIVVTLVVVASQITGQPRTRWLLTGAPPFA